MNALINVVIIGGLFTLAYFTARLLTETFGVPRDSCEDAQCCPPPDPEAVRPPTQQEWEDFQRSLDDEGLDQEDHNG